MKKLMSIIISMVLGVMIAMPVSAAEAMLKEDVIEKEEINATSGSNYFRSQTIRLNSAGGNTSSKVKIPTGSVIGSISSIILNVRAGGDPFKLYLQSPDGTLFWIVMDATGEIGVDKFNGQNLSGSWMIWIETLGTASTATISVRINYDCNY